MNIPWSLRITKVDNGFVLSWDEEADEDHIIPRSLVVEESAHHEFSEIDAMQRLLWEVMEHFGYYGSKHDKKRLFVRIEEQHED